MIHALSRKQEISTVLILCLVIGVMAFDQASVNFLMPFIQSDLNLRNTEVGLLMSAYWAGFAISTYATSFVAESIGRRKLFLLSTLVLFSLCSFFPAYTNSFDALLVVRATMGLLAGPMMPLTQSIIALESADKHRGTNMGLVGNLGAVILGLFVAPLLQVKLASTYGWRSAFFVILAPGFLSAVLLARFVREPTVVRAAASPSGRLAEVLRYRNVYLCALLCVCYLAYGSVGNTFLPLFYVNVKHFTAQQMSFLMGPVLGISFALFSMLFPVISDRIGRRTVMVLASLLSVSFPLVVIYFTGPIPVLAILLAVSSALSATASIFTATVPSESVPSRSISTAMGVVIAAGTIGGGFAGPAVAGWCADRWGLQAALTLQAGCAVAAVLAATALRETAPRKIKNPVGRLASETR
jgi:MFS family permease